MQNDESISRINQKPIKNQPAREPSDRLFILYNENVAARDAYATCVGEGYSVSEQDVEVIYAGFSDAANQLKMIDLKGN